MQKFYIFLFALFVINSANAQWVWQNPSTTYNTLYSICFPTSSIGYIVGGHGTILKTLNGGEDWEIQTSGTLEYLNSVFFVDENTGYAVGVNGTILKTTNGGEEWVIHPLGELGCSKMWRLMMPTFLIWAFALVLGLIIHIYNIV